MRKGMMLFATLCSLRLTPSRIIGGFKAVVKKISAMNIHKENFFEQKDKRAKQRKYSLTKIMLVLIAILNLLIAVYKIDHE